MAWWYLQPVALKVPDTEELIDSGPKRALISDSFSFGITKEAVYLATRKKGFPLREPFETTRYPLSSIRGVALYPARVPKTRIAIWTLIVFALALAILSDVQNTKKWPFGLLFLTVISMRSLVGMILGPRGRYRVRIDAGPQPLDFEPQLESIISAKAKAEELEVRTQFLDACRRAGISVVDSRESSSLGTP